MVELSYADGVTPVNGTPTATVTTSTEIDLEATTTNVIADSPGGNPEQTVVVGAHLDSVVEGPGINDNGSGSATILEIAEAMDELGVNPRRAVRFAFWGAEESGLLGSEYYVENLDDDALGEIYANLNFDMVGSPNYVRFVYDGDGSAGGRRGRPARLRPDRVAVQRATSTPRDWRPSRRAFDGRSDYGPFIAAGIPAGGLFTGAEGIKTPAQAAIYGGTAGIAYDPCYHQACDTINNLSTKALNEMSDAAAHATLTLARSRTGFFEDGSRRGAAAVSGPWPSTATRPSASRLTGAGAAARAAAPARRLRTPAVRGWVPSGSVGTRTASHTCRSRAGRGGWRVAARRRRPGRERHRMRA